MIPEVVALLVERYLQLLDLGIGEVEAILQALDEIELLHKITDTDYEMFLEAIQLL